MTQNAIPRNHHYVAEMHAPEKRKRIAQASKVKAIAAVPSDILAVSKSRGMVILAITDPGESFILGSQPIARKPGDLRDADSEVWLPVALDIAIGIGGASGTVTIRRLTDRQPVAAINRAIADQCSMFGAQSKPLVDQLAAQLKT